MQSSKKRDDKISWLLEKYKNINTSCAINNYEFVLKVSSEILEVYPHDDFALYSYAGCLCINGEFKEAKEILEFLFNNRTIDKSKYVLISLIHVESGLGNFEKAYEYVCLLKQFFPQMDLNYYETFFRYKLYGETTSKTPKFFYDYDLDSTLKHISNRHLSNTDTSCFSENIDLETTISDISKQLEDIPLSMSFNPFSSFQGNEINGKYYFKFPRSGYDNGHVCNYLKVITVPYSKKIISMFPALNVHYGFDVYEIKKEKVLTKDYKPISQIDKFNKRWGR